MQALGDLGDPNSLRLNDVFASGMDLSKIPAAMPAGGFQMGQWYYVAGVFDQLGSQTVNIYVSDGTAVWSDTKIRTDPYVVSTTDRFRINGNYVEAGVAMALDNFTIYDTPFDPNSELVQIFGIPEAASLALLAVGALLLARRG